MERLSKLIQSDRVQTFVSSRKLPWLLAALAAVAMLPSLGSGFMEDDHLTLMRLKGLPDVPAVQGNNVLDMHVPADGNPEHTRKFMDMGRYPWWTDEYYKHAFFRPLSALTHYADWYLFGQRAWPMHAHNILLYAIMVFVLAVLYRRLVTPAWVAALAGLMYALDASHAGSIGWISARNAPLPGIFILLVLYFHDRWRRGAWKPGIWAALASLIVGLTASEGAVASGAYLAGYALFLDTGPLYKRFVRLLPYLAVVIVWRVIYVSLGYGVAHTMLFTDPLAEPGKFVFEVIERLPILLFSLLVAGEPGIATFVPAPWGAVCVIVSIAAIVVLAWILWPLLKRNAEARFWTLGMVLSTIPICTEFPQGRELMNPGIGGFALIALFLGQRMSKEKPAEPESPRYMKAAKALTVVWLILHIGVSAITAPLTAYTGSKAPTLVEQRLYETAPWDDAYTTLVTVYLPGDVMTYVLPIMRAAHGGRVPPYGRTLSAGVRTVEVKRTDERSIVIRLDDTFLTLPYTQVYRDVAVSPMYAGQTVRLTAFEAKVLSVTPDGRPQEVAFRFDVPLEDPSLRWVTFDNDAIGYKPFELPAIGQKVTITAPSVKDLFKIWYLNK